ncbi:phage baseplate assembly protein V [Vibrio mediterranei]|uniref:phage baseplate assembly protein V n=1 Tax=Vibrio mediterranei TaxID=689 RepID=UPI0022851087|nr:phage baseplate assembly protein V [Vibrio mediterranei]MCY9855815.1 phage baseplate assembly protein V [Vibrio mediterranei]
MISAVTELLNRAKDILSRLSKVVCIGHVVEVDSAGYRVKVRLPGMNNMTTGYLQVLTSRARGVTVTSNLAVGETVLCLFPPVGDMARGFVLGALYTDKNAPHQTSADVFSVRFEDGTVLSYDQSTKTGELRVGGTSPLIRVNASQVQVDASHIVFNGEFTVNGNSTLNGTNHITSTLTVDGAVNGKQTGNFMGTVGAAGYGGAVGGAPASMSNGAQVTGSMTKNGDEVTTMTHHHVDAEGRPTSDAKT